MILAHDPDPGSAIQPGRKMWQTVRLMSDDGERMEGRSGG